MMFSRFFRKEVILVLRLVNFLFAHRSMVRLVVVVAAVAVMTLASGSIALADDGVDP